jgi:hypothetical protein
MVIPNLFWFFLLIFKNKIENDKWLTKTTSTSVSIIYYLSNLSSIYLSYIYLIIYHLSISYDLDLKYPLTAQVLKMVSSLWLKREVVEPLRAGT